MKIAMTLIFLMTAATASARNNGSVHDAWSDWIMEKASDKKVEVEEEQNSEVVEQAEEAPSHEEQKA